MVDPVTRAISCSQQGAPTLSDASKVVAKGLGLTKGFIGQKNSFSVDCSKAGVYDCDCVVGIFLYIRETLNVLNNFFFSIPSVQLHI